MNLDAIYLKRVEVLEQIAVGECDEFSMLLGSGHLRVPLLDGDPLINQVNRDRRIRVRFQATAEDAYTPMVFEDAPVFWAWFDGISPRMALRPNAKAEELSRDALLAKRAAFVNGHDVSVKDVILQVAHVSGGIHFGVPKTEIERQLGEFSETFSVGGMSAVTRTLRGIADVVITGLRPLTQRVREDQSA